MPVINLDILYGTVCRHLFAANVLWADFAVCVMLGEQLPFV